MLVLVEFHYHDTEIKHKIDKGWILMERELLIKPF